MKLEIFHVQKHVIRCEIYESELKMSGKSGNPITLFAFVLGSYSSDLLLEFRERLWLSIARIYLIMKGKIAKEKPNEVIGRISFECDDTHVEFEFRKFTKKALSTLVLIIQFVRQYPNCVEINISREGPILIRFRSSDVGNASEDSGVKALGLNRWLATIGKNLQSIIFRIK